MTVSHILAVLSSSDLIIDVEIIEMNVEPKTQSHKMICRWDNAPHWRGIRTFPFHLHIPDKDKPVECGEVFVSDVLLVIRDIVKEKVL